MIKKITCIKNVGKFKHFSETDDSVSFRENTFIFAKNTHGKSTLTSILKSLATNNPKYILKRKTFNSRDQNIVIEMDRNYIFNTSWNNNYKKIKFFDSEYILDNVYSNDIIDEEKQEKIASIILGQKGLDLEKVWQETKTQISNNANRKSEIARIYSSTFNKNAVVFSDFLKLQENIDISVDIKKEKDKLESYSNQEAINSTLEMINNEIDKFSLDKTELNKTLEMDQVIVNKHLSNHLKTSYGAINFISSGVQIMKNNLCPFCSQNINESEPVKLLKAYNILFSQNYKDIKESLRRALSFLNGWEFEKNTLTFSSKLADLGLDINISTVINTISEQKKILVAELIKKNEDLTYQINFESMEKIEEDIKTLKLSIAKHISVYAKSFESEDISRLRFNISKLEAQEKRYQKTWKELCDEYLDLENKYKDDLKPKEETAFREKNEYANNILSQYESEINDILVKLGAGFKLTSFSIPGNRIEKIKLFSILFKGYVNEISLTDSDLGYSIKNTLSDSDRRLLAFAFFVVDVKNTPNLSDYIVVLDDPMSSYDIDRKRFTVKVLRDDLLNVQGEKPLQLIILTHEENFLKLLYENFKKNEKFLSIKYSINDDTSKIISCNIVDEFLKLEHYKMLEYYEKCLNGNIEKIDLSNMRIVLEEIIKMNHYLLISKTIIENGSIISWYKENYGSSEVNKKIEDIIPNLSHHTQSNRVAVNTYTEEDKKGIVKDFIDLLPKI